jgi:hypothetical protein
LNGGSVNYISLVYNSRSYLVENDAEFTVTDAGTLRNLRVDLNNNPGNNNTYTFTVRVNNADPPALEGLSCFIFGNTNVACEDSAGCVNVAAGDEIALQVTPNSNPNGRRAGVLTVFRPGDTCP